jgi:hypothetical protein
MLNCESSEAKRICSIVEKFFRSEANMFILKNLNIEAKRTGSIVILYFKKRKKRTFVFFKNEGQRTNGFDSNYRSFAIPNSTYTVLYLLTVRRDVRIDKDGP